MPAINVAALQMTSSADCQHNLDTILLQIATAVEQGARLLVLPENALLFSAVAMRGLTESKGQQIILGRLKQAAEQYKVWLVIGSHPSLNRPDGMQVANGRVRQSCLVISPTGELTARYDKIHLFDVVVEDGTGQYEESKFIEPGDISPVVVDIDGVKVGLTICYDLRFPELFRCLVAMGAELILVPAAFTYHTGAAHWDTLLRARAIENQVYVMGVNQCGYHSPTRQTYGHSVCYSPWGDIVGQLEEVPSTLSVRLDMDDIALCQSRMPVLKHRRII